MTDHPPLAVLFPGIDEDELDRIAGVLDDPTPANVAAVLNRGAEQGHVPPGDYVAIQRRQLDDDYAVVACDTCGKHFTGETVEAAERKVNGHQSTHRVSDDADDVDDDEPPTSIRDAEKRLEEQTDREAGDYPSPFEAVPELQEGAENEAEAETDGGG